MKRLTFVILLLALSCSASNMFKLRCTHCKGTGFHVSTDIVCVFCDGKGFK